jgi:diaminohydroxyphosphoribosylaminopyrimidine deaminase/5-amino-6-(5-phosphoribosylamino)uracil reductase
MERAGFYVFAAHSSLVTRRPSLSEMSPEAKEAIMRRCIELARKGWGKTHPNPMVGAAIVEGGKIVAEGWHEKAGGAHAEVAALKALKRPPKRAARMFVTLEPCSTKSRTPPCTDAIIESGIRHVIVGAVDPNPVHAGRGLEILKHAKVSVETRILSEECEDVNLIFNHRIVFDRPLIAGKFATTIDGRIATRSGESKWITGEAARADVMKWRRLFPAIAVGADTALHDQPRLTSRIEGEKEWCPVRFVFDGRLRTGAGEKLPAVYTDEFRERTVVVTSLQAPTGYVRKLENLGVRVWALPDIEGRVSIDAFGEKCEAEGIGGVFVEGGSRLLSEFLRARDLDYVFAYRAPVLFADDRATSVMHGLRTEKLEQAVRLERVRHDALGGDQLMRGFAVYPGGLSVDETVFGDR